MTEFQNGRVGGIFSTGEKIEHIKESYEKEVSDLHAMAIAFAMASKCLEDYRNTLIKDLDDARITIREAEYAKVYITRCNELINRLRIDAEIKKNKAEGATIALDQAIKSMKRLFDDENDKLQQHIVYEKTPEDILNRPVGADPGNPIENYKKGSKKKK